MFYSVFVLGKKGPLARVWLAAHWDKKITKAQILETDIPESVEAILQRDIRLSLRTSSHLMIGICRIYARKANYLLQDCQEAAFRLRNACRPNLVDLPDHKVEAQMVAITLAENYEFIDPVMPNVYIPRILNRRAVTMEELIDIDEDEPLFIPKHMQETLPLFANESFSNSGSINLIDASQQSLTSVEIESNHSSMIGSQHSTGFGNAPRLSIASQIIAQDPRIIDDGFGNPLGVELDDRQPTIDQFFAPLNRSEVAEDNLIDEVSMHEEASPTADNQTEAMPAIETSVTAMNNEFSFRVESVHGDQSILSMGAGGDNSLLLESSVIDQQHFMPGQSGLFGAQDSLMPSEMAEIERPLSVMSHQSAILPIVAPEDGEENLIVSRESFPTLQLQSIDSQLGRLYQPNRERRRRRNPKLIVDKMKRLNDRQIKAQMENTNDIGGILDLAPPTRRLMQWKRDTMVDHLFTKPGKKMPSSVLSKYYSNNLLTKAVTQESEEAENIDLQGNNGEVAEPTVDPIEMDRELQQATDAIEPLDMGTLDDMPEPLEMSVAFERRQPEEQAKQQENSTDNLRNPLSNITNRNLGSLPEAGAFRPQDVLNSTTITENRGRKRTRVDEIIPEFGDEIDLENNENIINFGNKSKRLKNSAVEIEDQRNVTEPGPGEIGSRLLSDGKDFEISSIQQTRDADTRQSLDPMAAFSFGGDSIPSVPENVAENTVSLEPIPMAEESIRGANETKEQFEQRVLTQRTSELLTLIGQKFGKSKKPRIAIDQLMERCGRKMAVQRFYSLLVLQASQTLALSQPREEIDSSVPYDGTSPAWMQHERESYPPIFIEKGVKYSLHI